jgi:L-ascorbate metabolism protein UlaG (beta-lactamase superfamily)
MRVTKFGHSCLLVEEGGARVLLDPGTFSEGFEGLEDLTAVCLTHQHADHLDAERLRLVLDRNPGARWSATRAAPEPSARPGPTSRWCTTATS